MTTARPSSGLQDARVIYSPALAFSNLHGHALRARRYGRRKGGGGGGGGIGGNEGGNGGGSGGGKGGEGCEGGGDGGGGGGIGPGVVGGNRIRADKCIRGPTVRGRSP